MAQRISFGKVALLILSLLLLGLAAKSPALLARPASPAAGDTPQAAVYRGVQPVDHFDVSPPLRDVKPILNVGKQEFRDQNERGEMVPPDRGFTGDGSVIQRALGPLVIPTPLVSFNGPPNVCGGCAPPDTNGEIGPNHYVITVNSAFQIFNRTGTSLFGPANINTLFAGFGGACQTENSGDPVVLYDQLADRFLISQFTAAGPTYFNCVALSTSPDPLGTYYRYAFTTGTNFPDYPKYGMAPNAYLISTREFAGGSTFAGVGAYAANRAQMLVGNPNPTVVSFLAGPNPAYNVGDGLLPMDLDGTRLPPAGNPVYYMGSMDNDAQYGAPQDALTLWKFVIDFVTPANSSFTLANTIPIAPYDTVPSFCSGRACIPQPGTANKLDMLSYRQRPMFRLAYRNMGTYESLVTNQSVEASPTVAGIRWWEVRSPNSSPILYQDATYAPGIADGIYRWMGSMAMDASGNIALGYSAASATLFPSIRYTGRLVTDPINTLPQGEGEIVAGTGSQTGGGNRWGDYSDMTVDPLDDCTFWYTTEYVPVTSATGYQARIGSFKFPSCTNVQGTPTPTVTGTPPTATRTGTSTVTSQPTNTPTRTSSPTITATVNPCQVQNYLVAQSTGATIVPGSTFVTGSNCDDCSNAVALPFPFQLYGQTFNTVNAVSNGNLQFLTTSTTFTNTCLPYTTANYAILPHWDDLLLTTAGDGIYTSTSGNAPNRIFNIEWRGCIYNAGACGGAVNFEVRLYEGAANGQFEFIYGATSGNGVGATIGVQKDTGSLFTQFSCNTASLSTGLKLTFTLPACGTPSATVPAGTATRTPTQNPAASATPCTGGPITFQGSLATGDTTMPQRLFRDAIIGTCAAPKVFPGTSAATPPYYYDTYSVANTGGSTVCVTVDLTAATCNAQLSLYLGSFDPNNVATNYANDPGSSTGAGGTVTTSVNVPNGQTLVIVVNDPTGTTGCATYTVTVTGLSSCSTPVPGTATVAVPSATATSILPTITLPVPTVTGIVPTITSVVPTVTGIASATRTVAPGVTATTTVCPVQFQDVDPTDPFYTFIRCLACRGIISGYSCGGAGEPCVPPANKPYFRTNALITRAQVSKIVSLAAGLNAPIPSGQQTFEDVPSSNPFWVYIERLATAGYISGYACGSPSEPCQPPANRPYFRPFASITRGQLAKIDTNAAGYTDVIPSGQQTFEDVPNANPFWLYIERASIHGVISGYTCGGPGEPCVGPNNRPYFRTFASTTRGQASKIIANTFFPGCVTP